MNLDDLGAASWPYWATALYCLPDDLTAMSSEVRTLLVKGSKGRRRSDIDEKRRMIAVAISVSLRVYPGMTVQRSVGIHVGSFRRADYEVLPIMDSCPTGPTRFE